MGFAHSALAGDRQALVGKACPCPQIDFTPYTYGFCVLLLPLLMTKLSMPWAQPHYQIYTFIYLEEAGCDVSGVADFLLTFYNCK